MFGKLLKAVINCEKLVDSCTSDGVRLRYWTSCGSDVPRAGNFNYHHSGTGLRCNNTSEWRNRQTR